MFGHLAQEKIQLLPHSSSSPLVSSEGALEHTLSSPALWWGEMATGHLHYTFPHRDIGDCQHCMMLTVWVGIALASDVF